MDQNRADFTLTEYSFSVNYTMHITVDVQTLKSILYIFQSDQIFT